MNITVEESDKLTIVFAAGEIDVVTCTELEEVLNGLISKGQKNIILDFDDVHYISSAGLRVVLGAIQDLHGTGRFALSRLNDDVREIIEMAGFLHIVTLYDDLEKARKSVSKP